MNRRFSTSLALALAAMLLSCTKTGTRNEDILPEGSRPLELTAATGSVTRSVAGKTAWNPGDGENLFIAGKTSEQLHIIDSQVTLMDVEITGGIVTEGYCGITLQGNNKGSTPGREDDDPWKIKWEYPGILPKSGSLQIDGDGRLEVRGGCVGAGIGGGRGGEFTAGATIEIFGGEIHATGGYGGGAGLADGTAKSDCYGYINIYKNIKEVNVYLYNVTDEGEPLLGIGAWGESSCKEVNIDTDLTDGIVQNTPELYHRRIYHP